MSNELSKFISEILKKVVIDITKEQIVKQVKKLIIAMGRDIDNNLPEKIVQIITVHSTGAALAGFLSGWIPGIGAIIATLIGAGFIWSMYSRIGKEINLPFSNNIAKTLLFGAITNVGASIIGRIVLVTIISFIPGLNFLAATIIMAITNYALTFSSGYVYLKIMTRLFNQNKI